MPAGNDGRQVELDACSPPLSQLCREAADASSCTVSQNWAFRESIDGLWVVLLVFGSTLIEKYDVVAIQLLYSLIFYHLLQHPGHNVLSIDSWIARRSVASQSGDKALICS